MWAEKLTLILAESPDLELVEEEEVGREDDDNDALSLESSRAGRAGDNRGHGDTCVCAGY